MPLVTVIRITIDLYPYVLRNMQDELANAALDDFIQWIFKYDFDQEISELPFWR